MLSLALAAALRTAPPPLPAPADAYCFDAAARLYGVNSEVLVAIAWHESHFLHWKVHRNSDGSTDYGLMQINSRNLPRLHLDPRSVMPPCANIVAAARLYRHEVLRWGNTWNAVGAYHSTTPALQHRYADDIAQRYLIVHAIDRARRLLGTALDALRGEPLPLPGIAARASTD